MLKTYYVPADEQTAELEVKKSRFIACAQCANDRAEALAFLGKVKNRYPAARHYCWAYLVGNPAAASTAAMNDDGEPGGTAGKPILNVIQHKKIGNVVVVVVRYFGGIKLGAGGLTRAYSAATEAVLTAMTLVEHIPRCQLRVSLAFAQENVLRHWLLAHNATILALNYENQIEAHIELAVDDVDVFVEFSQSLSIRIKSEPSMDEAKACSSSPCS